MFLKHLTVLNYKNIGEADLELSPKINCFIGNNGEGKTNLLDSVYFLSFCKSHNNAFDSLNIRHDQEYAMLTGTYQKSEDNLMEITVGMKRKGRKVLKKNKKEYDRQADHIGEIPLVLVSPADQVLIIGGSEERRKFMDGVIAQYDHPYLNHLLAYGRALKQRNSLLKQECTDDSLFDVLEQQMDISSQYLFDRRKDFVERFTPIFQQFYSFISEDKEQVSFGYTSHLQGSTPLADLLRSHRATDRLIGYTTKGCHRDDLEMRLGDYPLRGTASQGQAKTYLIALKLAQFDFLSHLNGTLPILLFDDIFDKLDAERVEQLVELMKQDRFGQTFISDTDREHIARILEQTGSEYKIWHVERGEIKE
ncbi:MAG: DNA replication/repair protein RecF [Paludibacteraceae bacterium]|nr:DNA replication/repair protein RecF [Paludibacteraceae bacterium]